MAAPVGFTERNRIEITPTLLGDERMANQSTLHMLSIYDRLGNQPHYWVDAYKFPTGDPYHLFSWQTDIEVEKAVSLLDNAHKIPGLDAEQGEFITATNTGEYAKYDWVANTVDDPAALSHDELNLATARVVRLEVEKGTLAWWRRHGAIPERVFGVITSESILSDWVATVMEKTATNDVKAALTMDLGVMASHVAAFNKLPFSNPLLAQTL